MTDATEPSLPEEPKMEFHKPRPWHNIREFLKEFGTIALGVGVALGAEQAVEWWHWRGQVAEAREVIATELTSNLVGAIYRMRGHDCTDRRLDELALMLDGTAKTGSLPPLGDVGVPWRQTWPSGAWESVVASQTAAHFPRQLLVDISTAYKIASRIEEYNAREVEAWNVPYSMVGPGRRLDPTNLDRLREAISQVRTDAHTVDSLSTQLVEAAAKLPLPFDWDRIASAQRRPLGYISICQPIGAAATAYGQGFTNSVMLPPARMEAAMKSLRPLSGGAP